MSNRIPRSLGDELSVERWSRVVDAVQGVWQSETSNGVSVGKSGRLTHWSAFGKSGDRIEIPPSSYNYMALVAVNPNMSDPKGTGTLKMIPVQANEKYLTILAENGYFYAEGTFVNIEDVQGELL